MTPAPSTPGEPHLIGEALVEGGPCVGEAVGGPAAPAAAATPALAPNGRSALPGLERRPLEVVEGICRGPVDGGAGVAQDRLVDAGDLRGEGDSRPSDDAVGGVGGTTVLEPPPPPIRRPPTLPPHPMSRARLSPRSPEGGGDAWIEPAAAGRRSNASAWAALAAVAAAAAVTAAHVALHPPAEASPAPPRGCGEARGP